MKGIGKENGWTVLDASTENMKVLWNEKMGLWLKFPRCSVWGVWDGEQPSRVIFTPLRWAEELEQELNVVETQTAKLRSVAKANRGREISRDAKTACRIAWLAEELIAEIKKGSEWDKHPERS